MSAYDDDDTNPFSTTPTPSQNNGYVTNKVPPTSKPPAKPTTASGLFANAIKEGWTMKKGPQALAGWKRRYLQLNGNKQLSYYTDETMVAKKGTIFLSALTIHHIKRSSKTSDSKHFGFIVVTDPRTYHFCVQSATDRDHWIQKIREVVDETWDAHKIESSISYSTNQHPIMPHSSNPNLQTAPMKQLQANKKEQTPSWDDDEQYSSKGRTLAIKNNLLQESKTAAAFDEDDDGLKDDRFSHRSKYKRRNQQQQVQLTEEEAKQKVEHLEQQNDALLDEALRTTYETQGVAADTAMKLDSQRHQLLGIDKNLHEIDQNLDKTEGILDGMKSWGGMIKRKLKKNKDPPEQAYQAPVSTKSAFERNQHRKQYGNDAPDMASQQTQVSQYEADNVQNEKLDELLKGVKTLNQTAQDINTELDEQDDILTSINDKMDKVAPRMQQQVRTMKQIT